MKRSYKEILLACLLLFCFFYLSREAAMTSFVFRKTETENGKRKESEVQEMKDGKDERKKSEDKNTKDEKQEEEKKKALIVVDAGHGGMDPGMIGVGGREEKKGNLEIALKVKKNLETSGYQVIMTRNSDQGLYEEKSKNKKAEDLQNRISLIAEQKPVLTVSIHQNSYVEASVCGPQVFYYEDSVQGEKLAGKVQNYLNAIPGVLKQRDIKGNKSYYLLKRSPSVLIIVECGFLTNPDEAVLLESEEYQEAIAQAVTRGICDYLEEGETENAASISPEK